MPRVDVETRCAHHRKYGTTFGESWTTHDGTTIVALGAVLGGTDRIAVSDLLRAGTRALVSSRVALEGAVAALDRIVALHAREHRDDELAAAIALLAFGADGYAVDFVGAGNLDTSIFGGIADQRRPLHGLFAALGTGIAAPNPDASTFECHRLFRDDLVVASTVPVDRAWWPSGDRTAAALLRYSDAPDASAAVIAIG
jgi:hypothetical protein